MCGGTWGQFFLVHDVTGLSPRVRGNPAAHPDTRRARRSIPACAGEPGRRARSSRQRGVYPRVCGGTVRPIRFEAPSGGLSPRVRGNPAGEGRAVQRGGSIPACAGEPSRSGMPPWVARVYPRVCGGTRSVSTTRARGRGLSPRVRGNPSQSPRTATPPGSIPACAGEPLADSITAWHSYQ